LARTNAKGWHVGFDTGFARDSRDVSTAIANASNLADLSDYEVHALGGANPLTKTDPRSAICTVKQNDRNESIWRLIMEVSREISGADFVDL
jgi:hypothetical protein